MATQRARDARLYGVSPEVVFTLKSAGQGNQNCSAFLRCIQVRTFFERIPDLDTKPSRTGRGFRSKRYVPVAPHRLLIRSQAESPTAKGGYMQILRRTLCLRARNLFLIALLCMLPCASFSQVAVGVSVTVAPPELPVYEQPICPAANYMWTPGYWAWDPGSGGYYWVPGTWVMAPAVGLLWTPGYWGWNNGGYLWNAGYWGPQVGFYGGVNYGFGYTGAGFYGGRWSGGYFSYNTAVVRVNTTVIHNTYVDRTVIRNTTVNRVSYNGGRGGIEARPTAAQEAAARQKRYGPITTQRQQATFARQDKANFASVNHGAPAHAALARPATSAADFKRAVPASGAKPVTANETRSANGRPATTSHPANETRSATRPESKPVTTRPANETHPASKSTPTHRTAESRPATKPATATKPSSEATPAHETRPTSTRPASTARPANETRPATRPAPAEHTAETRPAPKPAPAVKPAPETRQASHPATPPQPTVKSESRPAPVQQAKPAPQPRPESRAAPVQQAKPAPQPRPETRPEPQPHPSQSEAKPAPAPKPAPEARPSQSAARPAPQQHESAPRPSGEKPHPS